MGDLIDMSLEYVLLTRCFLGQKEAAAEIMTEYAGSN